MAILTEFIIDLYYAFKRHWASIFVIKNNIIAPKTLNIKVYNVSGQMVDVIANGFYGENTYSFTWNASNMSSGVYIIKAESSSSFETQKVMLVK